MLVTHSDNRQPVVKYRFIFFLRTGVCQIVADRSLGLETDDSRPSCLRPKDKSQSATDKTSELSHTQT